ncbi:MAG TPA: integrase arm-type DNA-binding domain-containing protein [Burkholderiaceae bacterium]|nr:integrase arm-type DNA-binding domain-containing protein [Burkholderiaceae bacterium]
MALTDTAIRNAKPGLTPKGARTAKPYKLGDAGGLYVEVRPDGGKYWRLKYRIGGKEKRLSLGVYPEVTLAMARSRRDEARRLLADGIDPSEHRKAKKAAGNERAANSFEVVAREWFDKLKSTWNEAHADRILSRLQRDVFPWIGGRPIAEVTAPELLAVLRRIEARGALETAHRALGNCGQVFRYGVATGRCDRDPSGDLRGALPPVKGQHFAAVTEPMKVGALMRAIHGYQGTLTVQCALQLAPLVFVRPGELRRAQWADIDLDTAEWRFHVTKTDTGHIVPLSTQAIAILRELRALTSRGVYVFPGARSRERPMSDNAVLAALRRMGIGKDEMSGHGFRAMARTILDEVLGFRPDFIEHQLAHAVRDPNGRAYNRTAHLNERRKMMQAWADWLDKQRSETEVVPSRGGM